VSFSKEELKSELGCTELQARKIMSAVTTPPMAAGNVAAAGNPVTSTTTTTTTTAAQPAVVYANAPAPTVMYNGYTYVPRERYVGGITVLIAVLFCFPCIFCCPIDERDQRVAVAVPTQTVQRTTTTSAPQPQAMQ
jgi:hypothetical protein